MRKPTVHIASDHAGLDLKNVIQQYLIDNDYLITDHGAFDVNPDDDYPDFIAPVARAVSDSVSSAESVGLTDGEQGVNDSDSATVGIVLGGSGQGEAIVANRFPNVRAIVFNGQYSPVDGRTVPDVIETARQHNDANILSLGARFLNEEETIKATKAFLETEFSGDERHARRIKKIENINL